MKYVVALDQGTTSSRAVVFDEHGGIAAAYNLEFTQHYPHLGWVEHRPEDILDSQLRALKLAVDKAGIDVADIAAIGITNQRETTLLWERETGRPLANAIVWQCRRTAPLVERLKADGLGALLRDRTGLVPDAYFSGTKLQWLLDTIPGARARAERGELCFGTVDSFLVWNLCKNHPHVTDATNAARTMLFDIHRQCWDPELLRAMNIPASLMPEVVDSSHVVGMLRPGDSRGGACGRPARRALRSGLSPPRRLQKHLRNGLLRTDEHRRRTGSLSKRSAHHHRMASGRQAGLRAGGQRIHGRRGSAVAPG